jgi:hypothetical protein
MCEQRKASLVQCYEETTMRRIGQIARAMRANASHRLRAARGKPGQPLVELLVDCLTRGKTTDVLK